MFEIPENKLIVFDADVIIHFICGDKLLDLFNIFPNKSVIVDKVYDELAKHQKTKETIDNLLNLDVIEIVSFSANLEIIKEYGFLQKLRNKGRGESACMAYCLFTKDVVASSNLSDIQNYCNLHSIPYLTTMDFVMYSYSKGKWTMLDCEDFVRKNIEKNHKIPCKSFAEYITKADLKVTDSMNKDQKPKGIKINKDRLRINGTLDDSLRASVKKPKENKDNDR